MLLHRPRHERIQVERAYLDADDFRVYELVVVQGRLAVPSVRRPYELRVAACGSGRATGDDDEKRQRAKERGGRDEQRPRRTSVGWSLGRRAQAVEVASENGLSDGQRACVIQAVLGQ